MEYSKNVTVRVAVNIFYSEHLEPSLGLERVRILASWLVKIWGASVVSGVESRTLRQAWKHIE